MVNVIIMENLDPINDDDTNKRKYVFVHVIMHIQYTVQWYEYKKNCTIVVYCIHAIVEIILN